MISTELRELLEVPGLEAVLFFTYHRKEIYKWYKSEFNEHVIADVVETFIQIFGVQEKGGLEAKEIVIPYEKGVVIARPTEKFFVIVIGKHKMDIPLVRLILDIK